MTISNHWNLGFQMSSFLRLRKFSVSRIPRDRFPSTKNVFVQDISCLIESDIIPAMTDVAQDRAVAS